MRRTSVNKYGVEERESVKLTEVTIRRQYTEQAILLCEKNTWCLKMRGGRDRKGLANCFTYWPLDKKHIYKTDKQMECFSADTCSVL